MIYDYLNIGMGRLDQTLQKITLEILAHRFALFFTI